MKLVSSRDASQKVGFKEAILNPSANFGGLFTPKKLPKLEDSFFANLSNYSYKELAMEIIRAFKFDIEDEIFQKALLRYDNFETEQPPLNLKKIGKNLYINELYHGPTKAFKDMALQPFSSIVDDLAKKEDKKYLIICATSGDTGPATLSAFANSSNVKVACLYPKDGTSLVQRLQMTTIDAPNLNSIAIEGNFDDAQSALKALLANEEFRTQLKEAGYYLTAANSVNFGRILFQIIYHFYAYAWLLKSGVLKEGEKFDIVVPSGNFGNALGAYYAKKMGAKIAKIKIASNQNDVLTQFFNEGIYDIRERKLLKTISPAMDILISSNIERLLFDRLGDKKCKELMKSLKDKKFYKVPKKVLKGFRAKYCSDKEAAKFIKKLSEKKILIDPHTATCFKFQAKKRPTIITSTAHWSKFTPSMVMAIKNKKCLDEKKEMFKLEKEFGDAVPSGIAALFDRSEIHKDIATTDELKEMILKWVRK